MLPQLTNATKAAIIAVVNSALLLLQVFDIPVTDEQAGALGLFLNAVMGLYVALTYKDSPKRLPDGLSQKGGVLTLD